MRLRRGSVIEQDEQDAGPKGWGTDRQTSSCGCQVTNLTSCVCSMRTLRHSKSASGWTAMKRSPRGCQLFPPSTSFQEAQTDPPTPIRSYPSSSSPKVHHLRSTRRPCTPSHGLQECSNIPTHRPRPERRWRPQCAPRCRRLHRTRPSRELCLRARRRCCGASGCGLMD